MLAEVERIAREQRVEAIDIKVVNLRTDLIPWYISQGYEQTGTSPYPPDDMPNTTRPVHFIDMRRLLRYGDDMTASQFELKTARVGDAEEIMK
jgi:hypothetical protein